ncbi:hypothetical protein [Leptolyngbya sp. 7M]|uniref:hypothetical protein n=1 Tax=Leptolyngbya sp. 7M TaxID=2812896 RepID=UPI001B8CF62E|nr:hypothetical protein [Leptolyngbya sp. 7M]QYO64800.1 hypothetical protein JVX88_35375 [Leptolyngbya sp. 7M]
MSENNQSNQPNQPNHLPDPLLPEEKPELSIEIPADPMPVSIDPVPRGFDPMGEIHLRGRAYRGLAGGQVPWWVLLTGWFLFGGFALVQLTIALTTSSFIAWILLALAAVFLLILWRGTAAKMSTRRRR